MTETRDRSFRDPRQQILFLFFVSIDEARQISECLSRIHFARAVQMFLDFGQFATNPNMLLDQLEEFFADIVSKSMQRRKINVLFDRHMRLERCQEEQKIIQRHTRPATLDGSQDPIEEVTELLVLRRNPPFLTPHSHVEALVVGEIVLLGRSGHD